MSINSAASRRLVVLAAARRAGVCRFNRLRGLPTTSDGQEPTATIRASTREPDTRVPRPSRIKTANRDQCMAGPEGKPADLSDSSRISIELRPTDAKIAEDLIEFINKSPSRRAI